MSQEPPQTPMSFMSAYSNVYTSAPPTEFSEESFIERALDTLHPQLEALDSLPLKYLRALVAFTDLRILTLSQQMAQANDTITVAHVRGALHEAEALQKSLRWWLDIRKEQK